MDPRKPFVRRSASTARQKAARGIIVVLPENWGCATVRVLPLSDPRVKARGEAIERKLLRAASHGGGYKAGDTLGEADSLHRFLRMLLFAIQQIEGLAIEIGGEVVDLSGMETAELQETLARSDYFTRPSAEEMPDMTLADAIVAQLQGADAFVLNHPDKVMQQAGELFTWTPDANVGLPSSEQTTSTDGATSAATRPPKEKRQSHQGIAE